jgi:hypothetical protein
MPFCPQADDEDWAVAVGLARISAFCPEITSTGAMAASGDRHRGSEAASPTEIAILFFYYYYLEEDKNKRRTGYGGSVWVQVGGPNGYT